MTENEIATLVAKQREFFESGETLSIDYRIAALKRLKNEILNTKMTYYLPLKLTLVNQYTKAICVKSDLH